MHDELVGTVPKKSLFGFGKKKKGKKDEEVREPESLLSDSVDSGGSSVEMSGGVKGKGKGGEGASDLKGFFGESAVKDSDNDNVNKNNNLKQDSLKKEEVRLLIVVRCVFFYLLDFDLQMFIISQLLMLSLLLLIVYPCFFLCLSVLVVAI
jgi:hypothetical protein